MYHLIYIWNIFITARTFIVPLLCIDLSFTSSLSILVSKYQVSTIVTAVKIAPTFDPRKKSYMLLVITPELLQIQVQNGQYFIVQT